ncbi:MAG: NCS2 family permease [Spirochaetes bacterium]|nr:NCS2 family permease [Spirochaetota bacterium]
MALQDVLAAIGVVLNGIPMMIFAMSFGFMTVPTAIGYLIAAAGMLAYGAITPVSIQAGTIALVGTMGKSLPERLSMALFSGLVMALVGAIGLIHTIMGLAGARVVFAMQAGVGIILARVAFDMIKANKFVGIVSMASALLVFVPTQNLIYTVVVSVIVSSGASFFKNKAPANTDTEKYKFKLYKPIVNYNVIRGALALVCLTIGSNIAFGNITAGMAGVQPNINHLTLYSGLANLAALFGGAPVEAIISATGAAPNPLVSGVLMMLIMAVILITGILPKIARFVPMQSIAGFLFVIGAFATIPGNAFNAFNGAARPEFLAAGMTLLVTALSDPFIGLVAGVLVSFLVPIFGI